MKSVCIYGLGDGLGHTIRVLALARALLEQQPGLRVDCLLPERVRSLKLLQGVSVHSPPPESQEEAGLLAQWLDTLWAQLKPDLLVVDVFPLGILAEFLECRRFPAKAVLLTRICRQGYYESRQMQTARQRYREIFWMEACPAPPALPGAVEVGPVTLFRRQMLKPAARAREDLGFGPNRNIGVLVLRATPPEERRQLATALRGLSEGRGDEPPTGDTETGPSQSPITVTWADPQQPSRVPIFPYFLGADLIVSAASYHSLYELSQLQIPTVFWPQNRLYDDQHLRLRLLEIGSQPKHWIVQSGHELSKAFEEFEHLRSQVAFRRGGRDIEYSGALRLAKSLLRRFTP